MTIKGIGKFDAPRFTAANFRPEVAKDIRQKNKPIEPENTEIARMKRWAQDEQRAQTINTLYNKLMNGTALSKDELEYLRANSPENYEKAVQVQQEREQYKKELNNCKTKEDVEKLGQRKMNQFYTQAQSVSANANIPKAKKLEMLDVIAMRAAAVRDEHTRFIQTEKYQRLPERAETDAAAQAVQLSAEEPGENPAISLRI